MLSRVHFTRWLALSVLLSLLLVPWSPAWANAPEVVCNVQTTPYFTEYFGDIVVDGAPAPIGAVVEAVNGQGAQAGCFVVTIPGIFGYMRVYGADAATGTPGMANNEAVTFKINSAVATSVPASVLWSGDNGQHQVGLSALALPAAVGDLAAEKVSTGVKLTWTHVGGSLNRYEVWRGETPYFTPGLSGSIKIAPNIAPPAHIGDPLEFTDTSSHVGSTAIEDYYVVVAVGTNGQTSLVSNRVGACDFSLQPGG